MPSIFSQIITGKISCYKVDEDEEFLAFLDVNIELSNLVV